VGCGSYRSRSDYARKYRYRYSRIPDLVVRGTSWSAEYQLRAIPAFLNYNLKGGWALSTAPIITANWNATQNKWAVPLGAVSPERLSSTISSCR
jgi:hypothetical protein